MAKKVKMKFYLTLRYIYLAINERKEKKMFLTKHRTKLCGHESLVLQLFKLKSLLNDDEHMVLLGS